MNNYEFLNIIKDSFIKYLETSPQSNEKLKILHGAISKDLSNKLGPDYKISSLGFDNGKENKIEGRYLEKAVDISITKSEEVLAGLAVKFIMSNYSQNTNNYFEGMLGETANIRSTGKAYYQIIILPKVLPYFSNQGKITKWETISKHGMQKYITLSKDNIYLYLHTPIKTLFYIIEIPGLPNSSISNKEQYINNFNDKEFKFKLADLNFEFGNNVICNDYELFINKIVYSILSI